MAHIHLQDAALSIQFLIFWWILAAVLIKIALLLASWQSVAAQRLSIAAIAAAASFVIRQVDAPFAARDLADYNAYTERLRQ